MGREKMARRVFAGLMALVCVFEATGCSRSRSANRIARRRAPIAPPVVSEGPGPSEVPLMLPPAGRIPSGDFGSAYGPVPGVAVAPLGSAGASRDIRYPQSRRQTVFVEPPANAARSHGTFIEPRGSATRPQTTFVQPNGSAAPSHNHSLDPRSGTSQIRPTPMPAAPAQTNDVPVNVPSIANGSKRNGNGIANTQTPVANGRPEESKPTATDEATGIPNYTIVEANVATGGQPTLDGMKWLKERGFRAVLNLLPDDEADPAEASMVRELGLEYISLPVTASSLNREAVETFNHIVDDAKYRPLFVHDSTGARTGALWYLHRVGVDQVPEDRARSQATRIGLKDSDTELWLAIQRTLSEAR